jgi:DnaK suppressor protein
MMNEEKHEKLRARLLELRAELMRTAAVEIEPARRDPGEVGSDEDEAPLAEMLQVIASSRNRSRARDLQRIEAALVRLEREPEEFGLCRTCEEEIAEKRLFTLPYVERCVECQGQQDAPRGGARRHLTDFGG